MNNAAANGLFSLIGGWLIPAVSTTEYMISGHISPLVISNTVINPLTMLLNCKATVSINAGKPYHLDLCNMRSLQLEMATWRSPRRLRRNYQHILPLNHWIHHCKKFSCLKFWTPMIAKIIKKNSVTNTTFAIFGTAAMIEFTTNFKPGNRRTTRNGLKPRKARNERKALRVLKSPLPSVVENGGFMIKPTIDMLTKNPSNRFHSSHMNLMHESAQCNYFQRRFIIDNRCK